MTCTKVTVRVDGKTIQQKLNLSYGDSFILAEYVRQHPKTSHVLVLHDRKVFNATETVMHSRLQSAWRISE